MEDSILQEIKVSQLKGGARVPGSFRDPSGFVFHHQGQIFRQINRSYKENYDHLMKSGLYKFLADSRLLISHEEINPSYLSSSDAYLVVKPEPLPFVSYPYEWCFSALKAAALHTLEVQKIALNFDMSLKDCSAYNIQFRGIRPVLIDTLSFEMYEEGAPWVGYGQFCRHFLAPLTVMSIQDVRLSQLLRIYVDGIPLDLASSLLPLRTWLSFSALTHIHIHARAIRRWGGRDVKPTSSKMSRRAFLGLIDSLANGIKKMKWHVLLSEWTDYYDQRIHSNQYFDHKKQLVDRFLDVASPRTVWDLGSNTGLLSRQASDKGLTTVAFDSDPSAVEANFLRSSAGGDTHLLPLLLDLTNPSPDLGWANNERMALARRGPADMVMALALVHHLAISNRVPLINIAEFLATLAKFLIIEFVPRCDDQVLRLLATRRDTFSDYSEPGFEQAFDRFFHIIESSEIDDSKRKLYLMKTRGEAA